MPSSPGGDARRDSVLLLDAPACAQNFGHLLKKRAADTLLKTGASRGPSLVDTWLFFWYSSMTCRLVSSSTSRRECWNGRACLQPGTSAPLSAAPTNASVGCATYGERQRQAALCTQLRFCPRRPLRSCPRQTQMSPPTPGQVQGPQPPRMRGHGQTLSPQVRSPFGGAGSAAQPERRQTNAGPAGWGQKRPDADATGRIGSEQRTCTRCVGAALAATMRRSAPRATIVDGRTKHYSIACGWHYLPAESSHLIGELSYASSRMCRG